LLWDGLHVRLIRIREVVRKEIVQTPFQTLIRHSKDLVVGTMRILEEGQVGRTERTFRIRFRNGREVRRELLSERILSEPVDEVVLKGTFQPPPAPGNRQVGQASWYDFCPIWGMYAAHLTIPKGTLVHVRNLDNGETVDVVINDRGPYGVPGRIIDLCQPAFAAIAPLGQGVADVEITW
jgi:rare lipoprotein A (peptidoglycan hydrolase)